VKRTLKKELKEREIVMRGTWFDLLRSYWGHSLIEKSVGRLSILITSISDCSKWKVSEVWI